MSVDPQMRDAVANRGCSPERRVGLLRLLCREPKTGPARADCAAAQTVLGIAEISEMVGALIRQGQPLSVVLTNLCQLFDATVEGSASSVLILDRTGARVRFAAGSGLPASYLKQLEGRRVNWIGTPSGTTINAKTPVIALDPVVDSVHQCRETAAGAAPSLRPQRSAPILSLTGEPLGIFAVYQHRSDPEDGRCHSALISSFIQVVSATIERMRSDELLKRNAALLEQTQHLSSTCGFSWRVETDEFSWSNELGELFDLDPADASVTLERIGARIHAEDLPLFHEMVERARSGVSDFEFEHRLHLHDDTVKYVRVVAHRSRERDGPLEYIGAVQDVTHRRHTEQALAKLRAELARVARATSLGVLTAAIAHEVNQPLAGIMANASTCRRMLAVDPPDLEGARETARRTIRDAERASEVVKRLRALFAKKGTASESLDLNEATREVVALCLSELERNKVIVRAELAGELPRIQGDRIQLQQVIMNLLLNASDAMSGVIDRPRQLLIRTEREEEDGVRMSVMDTGIGVDPQAVERLFDSFYTTKKSGMGIGLSVSRFIVESHKGRLWAASNHGPGATFAFSIPCGPQGRHLERP